MFAPFTASPFSAEFSIMTESTRVDCADCNDSFSRRDFVKAVGGAAVAAGAIPLFVSPGTVQAAPTSKSKAETTVKKFYESLSANQKKAVCFGFDHPNRSKLNPNWHIVDQRIGSSFYEEAQRKLIDQVVKDVSSEDGYERFKLQMKQDARGGFGSYAVAVFGTPGDGNFELVLTGRHLTLRADGDSVKNMAFGGPIVYGHGQANPEKNLFHYQTKQANTVYSALDTKQRESALMPKAPPEGRVPLQGQKSRFPGIAVGEMSSDQKELVEQSIKVILAPYRTEDVDEALAILKQGGGLDKLHMAFYQQGDIKGDKTWDIWRLEGPSFVWHFRGAPHVHTYVNIGLKQDT